MYLGAIPTTGILNTAKAIAKRGQITRAGISAPTGVVKPPTIAAAIASGVAKTLPPVPQVIPAAPTNTVIKGNDDIAASLIALLNKNGNANWQADAANDIVRIAPRDEPAPAAQTPSWLIPALIAGALLLVLLARRKG